MMAAFISHVISTESSKILANSVKSLLILPYRTAKGAVCKKIRRLPKRYVINAPLQGRVDALKSRGFQRNIIPYEPPENTSQILEKNFQEIVGSTDPYYKLDKNTKYRLLCALKNDLGYSVPNSLLYKMDDLGSIYVFYTTPVDTTNPYDKFKEIELPPNLHIMYDYIRFNPQTDTKFGGISAFPKTSCIVSSIRAKKKGYTGHDGGNPWNDI